MPTYKSACRLYFASNVDAKNIAEVPRKLPFKWCYFWLEMLAQNVHISPQPLGKMGHQPFPITFSKNENDIYVQKVTFLYDFEKIFEKFQSVAKL